VQSKISFLTLSCLGAAGLTLAAAHPAEADPFLPVPPASFLNYHVGSADQLAEEVSVDAVVRARLARHFHQAEPEVSRYIQDNLVLTHLRKPRQFRVACVSPSGREYFVTERLAAGTGVFSLRSTGKPILKQACGNPLVAMLPAVSAKKTAPPQLAAAPKIALAQSAVSQAMPSDVVFTKLPPLEAAKTGNIGPFVKVAGITQSLGHSGGGGFVPAILGVAGLGLFGAHHGSPGSAAALIAPRIPAGPTHPVLGSPIVPAGTVPALPSPTVSTSPKPVAPTPNTPITPVVPTPTTQTPLTPAMPVTQTPLTPAMPVTQTPLTPAMPVTQTPLTPAMPVTQTPITPTTPVTQTPVTPTTPGTQTPVTPTTPSTQTPITPVTLITPPSQTPPMETPPVFTPPTVMPPTTPPIWTPPVTPPPFIGPPPVPPVSQSAVPEPGPVVIFGLGSAALCLLRLRSHRRRA